MTTHASAPPARSNASEDRRNDGASVDVSTGLKYFAKSGYAARGAIYLIVGGLALLAALGYSQGKTGGSSDALRKVFEAPGGWLILGLIALGLVGYSGWRFTQAITDTDRHGTDAKGLTVRAGLLISGITHVSLAIYSGYLAYGYAGAGSSSGGGQSSEESLSAWLLSQPYGKWLVMAVGLCIIGAGVAHLVKAYKTKYERWFDADPETLSKIEPVCRFGLAARGVVFGIIGGFFVYSGWTSDPSDAVGLGETLNTIRGQSFGTILLIVTALGLLAFGCYSLLEARYRRINGPA